MGKNNELVFSHYPGSKILAPFCELTSLSIDKLNFITCQFTALLLSFVLKKWVSHPESRMIFCLMWGVALATFCYGWQTMHLLGSAALSYFFIRSGTSANMPWHVFTVAMLYLSGLQLKRQFESTSYSLDITGPMMILTQKVTCLAFAIGDGRRERANQEITPLQKKHAIRDIPEPMEFWSYIFPFQSMLAGPFIFFKQYRSFIYSDESPHPGWVVLKKLAGSMFCSLLFLVGGVYYDIDYLRDPEFIENTSFWYKVWYIHLATFFERTMYYHAWILADAVCNASGLGYDAESGTWDLVTNVHALRFEVGQNFKLSLDVWNIGTMRWLRYVVYERCTIKIRTLATYMTSAVWHGFYPGYYLAFIGGALFTSTARLVRKSVRPLFMGNQAAKILYDIGTILTTRLVVAYLSFTFVLLDFDPSITVYKKLYFFLHIGSIGAFIILRITAYFGAREPRPTRSSSYTSTTALNGKATILGTNGTQEQDTGDPRPTTPTATTTTEEVGKMKND